MTKEEAAIRTLEFCGYTYHGGEHWKPPLGKQHGQREWVGLTDEEVVACTVHVRFEYDPPYIDKNGTKHLAHYVIQPGPTYRNIEAKLKEKNP